MRQLDGLRAVAVLLVPAMHWYDALPQWFDRMAYLGIRGFFVLSGFLITGILIRGCVDVAKGRSSRGRVLRRFYLRRTLRIFPLYYAVVLIGAAFGIGAMQENLGWNLLYLSNVKTVVRGEWAPYTAHFWSLACEEHFYLLWPWVVVFAGPRAVPWAALGMLAVAVVYAEALGHVPFAWNLLPGVLQFFAVGAALAWLMHERPGARWLRPLAHGLLWPMTLLYVVGVVLGDQGRSFPWERLQYSGVLPLAFGGAVALGAIGIRGPAGRLLASAPVVRIGRVSYGLYLLHNFAPWVLDSVARPLGWPAWMHAEPWRFVLLWAISFGLAFASWSGLEQPLLRLKRRLPYARPASVAPGSPEQGEAGAAAAGPGDLVR